MKFDHLAEERHIVGRPVGCRRGRRVDHHSDRVDVDGKHAERLRGGARAQVERHGCLRSCRVGAKKTA